VTSQEIQQGTQREKPTEAKSQKKAKTTNKTKIGSTSLFDATAFVQGIITDEKAYGHDIASERQQILDLAQAGDIAAINKTKEIIAEILKQYKVDVGGYTSGKLVEEIFSYAWGLDVLEELYWDDEIDEIRVNSPESVYVQRKGKNEKVNIKFKDEHHVRKILSRLFIHDRGVSLDASNPVIESIRLDGIRVTATCPPATSCNTMVLRKKNFVPTAEALIQAQTLDQKILDLLAYLVNGRANILISGGTGTGKTTLLRYLIRYMDENLRLVSLETDRELDLQEMHPERDIIEMEEHLETKPPLTMKQLFRTVLRYSPDVIILGEIRGLGEAAEAIKACERGADGSIATIHFTSTEEAIRGCGRMMLEEGLNLPLELAQLWVASAYDIVIQMFADTRKGIKKITRITEVINDNNEIKYNDLAVWVKDGAQFLDGHWEYPNKISVHLTEKMDNYNPSTDLYEKAMRLA